MRQKRTANKNFTTRVATVPWRVVDVRVLPGHRLFVRFVDGTEGEIDTAPFIFHRRPGVFRTLQDPKEFAKAYISHGAVTWPGELDMAPDAMYDDVVSKGTSPKQKRRR